jgi:tetratricopeptide (TPR) repeat protein
MTHPYGVRDVERLLGMPPATLRALVAAGFVTPQRGPRRALLFSFQDLIVLRAAQSLVAAKVPQRRIVKSLRDLRRQLPATMPLSGLSIGAVGDRVVVKEGTRQWQAESGQYLLAFDVEPVVAPGAATAAMDRGPRSEDDFEQGIALEEQGNREQALAAYERAIAADRCHLDAHTNRALLLQDLGRHADAERAYRDAFEACADAAVLWFNYALMLEDLGRHAEAARGYEAALRRDADFADAHYNLGLVYEKLGRGRDALRHFARYRQLNK